MSAERVLSGMRPTGSLHLGHYHGVLENWVRLQNDYECLFFVADWHALTTNYDAPQSIAQASRDMVIDWLAAGLDPEKSIIFQQSQVLQHAELHLLLSMMTPLGWLERVPTYKDQQEKLAHKDLSTYGFLGYPLLQSADILVYDARHVPVGEDQVPHIELTREVARRFNHLYGRTPEFEQEVIAALKKLGPAAKPYKELRQRYQQDGDRDVLQQAEAFLAGAEVLSLSDKESLWGWLVGSGKAILVEPAALLTKASKMPGLDGQKMSKSYNNTISLREKPEDVVKKLKAMPTDPARVRRTDVGNPKNCPVWQLHEVYSDEARKQWVTEGCTTAGIGCIDCKNAVAAGIEVVLAPMRDRAEALAAEPEKIERILKDGAERARVLADQTMSRVRNVMGLTGA